MAKQAKYLIDDAKFHIAGVATSWDYNNRDNAKTEAAIPDHIYDEGKGIGVSFKRDFQVQTSGKMALEMFFVTSISADGVVIKLYSTKKENLFEITTKNGKFYFNGEETDIAAEIGETRIKVSFDLDSKKAKFAVNGETAGFYTINDTVDAATLYIGSSGDNEIKITPIKNKLYVDFIANETFVGTQKNFPDEWALNGDFDICYHNTSSPQMNYTYAKTCVKKGNNSLAILPVEKTGDDVIVEGYFLLPEGADGFSFSLVDGDNSVFGVKSENNEFKTLEGEFLRKFTSNVWQIIRLETLGDDVTVKIDGKICGTFKKNSACFDALEIYFEPNVDASLSFTDIVCEANIQYDDYCPEPKVVRHPEYEVGMNICNMWREGHHFGWDRITYFHDNIPLIGPYDEGSPEVADWEIKMMVEHAVTFQHFCWYCPDSMINEPIKRSRMDHALRDGFMNARYSNMMKFIIMWENAGYTNTNPKDFLDYVWPYWCEYFFTDPRYLIINNRPLISLWASKYVDNWGGPEKAKEVIDYINNDIKKYGFDGVYLMNTAIREINNYKKQSDFCDITYAYHYGANGYILDYQLGQIDLLTGFNEKDNLAPFMQTVSVGYNDCAWRGASKRVPLISLEDHKTALEYIKKHGDESNGEWYNNIFMMSTWNEYGEGTYIMPSNIYGFGYLDNIREVFAPGSGKCENRLPDASQQKRITYLNKGGRALIRRLGFEKSDIFGTPNASFKKWDFNNKDTFEDVSAFGKHSLLEYKDNSVVVKPLDEAEHYSIHISDKNGICNGSNVGYVKVKLRTDSNAQVRFAFLTDNATLWNGAMCLNEDHVLLKKSNEYTEVVFVPAKLETWAAKITDIRLDNMTKSSFEVESVELMMYIPDISKFKDVIVNGSKLHFELVPYCEDGKVIVSIDPQFLFFRKTKLYHEYFPETKVLLIESDKVSAKFKIDSDIVNVEGKEIKLSRPVTMRDGLPTFVLSELCDVFGFKYSQDGGNFIIEV